MPVYNKSDIQRKTSLISSVILQNWCSIAVECNGNVPLRRDVNRMTVVDWVGEHDLGAKSV